MISSDHLTSDPHVEQEHLFRLMFENAAVGIAQIGNDGKFITINKKLTEILGYSTDELMQKSFQDITHADDLEKDLQLAEALFDGRINSYTMEKRYLRKDGAIVWGRLSASVVLVPGIGSSFFIGVLEDISEKKHAEEALRKSEQQLKMAAGAANMGTYFRNFTSGESFWSPEFVSLFGLEPGTSPEFKDGIPVAVHPDDRDYVVQLTKDHFNRLGGKEFNCEHRIILPDEKVRWVHIKGVTEFDEENNPLQTYGIAMDITERKVGEEALRKSEAKYRALFDSIDEGFCICEMLTDQEGNPTDYSWLEINPTFEKLTGLHDPVGRSALELVPNLERHWIDIYGKVALTGEPVRFQQWSTAMGRWFDVYAFRLGEPHLRQFGILFSDITSRKQSEEELRQKVEENEKMMEIIPAAILISNEKDCSIIRGNHMANQFLEAEPGENVAAHFNSERTFYRNGKELAAMELPIEKAARENRQILNEVLELLLPGGRWLHMYGSAIPLNDEKGEVRGAIAAFVDITKHIEAEKALRESEEKFRMLANHISQLAWMADNEGRIFWFNKRWLEYTGSTHEEVEGWGWTEKHHPDHLGRVLEKRKRAWESGQPWEDIFPIRGSDGHYRWFLSRAVPIKDDDGNIIRWFGTNTDITGQREYEELLKRNNELFENLLYITAHDLKGPVANMYMALNIFQNAADNKKIEIFGQFRQLVDRLDRTIKGVADILKVQKADDSVATTLYFNNVLNEILVDFKDNIHPGTIDSDFSSAQSIRYVGTFLYSIMKNLVSNAVKYKRDDLPLAIRISVTRKNDFYLLTVGDNGVGMDLKRYGNQLFSPFHRFNPRKAEGTGIGLYIVRNIIEKNGGYIEVDSAPGKGTTFSCYLKEY